ncbi:MAG: type II secretion system minor pseudopilin GspI [Bryobacteraceae bacterium]
MRRLAVAAPAPGVPEMRERGFTLLEMLVATLIMGIAVVSLLASISASLRNAGRLTDSDRAALLAGQKMNELLLDQSLPRMTPIEGQFDPEVTGGVEAGWRAQISSFEAPPDSRPGTPILERVELEIWWMSGSRRRTLALEGFRQSRLAP